VIWCDDMASQKGVFCDVPLDVHPTLDSQVYIIYTVLMLNLSLLFFWLQNPKSANLRVSHSDVIVM